MKNNKLFWLGVKSRAFLFFGVCLFVIGLYVLFFSLIGSIALFGFGIFLLIKGSQDKLNYRMNTGHIIYNGN